MKLEDIRIQIDGIDEQIVSLLVNRVALAKKSAEEKRKNNLPIKDEKREEEVLSRIDRQARHFDIDQLFIKKIYLMIFRYSRTQQTTQRSKR